MRAQHDDDEKSQHFTFFYFAYSLIPFIGSEKEKLREEEAENGP